MKNSAARKRNSARSIKKSNKFNIVAVISVVAIFVAIFSVQMKDMKKKDTELTQKSQNLQETYEAESNRTSELEKQRVYVQTKQYIEEAAKKLGFVYPDEIVLKPKNDNQ